MLEKRKISFSSNWYGGDCLTLIYLSQGAVLIIPLFSDCRRVYKRYTADGRPSEIMYDTNHITYTYNSLTHAMTAVTLDSDVYECVLGYRSNGSLYDQHEVTVNSKLGHLQFADVNYKYKYNK